MSDRNALAQVLRDRSIRLGDFILSSGARSSYYIDGRLTTMSGEGQKLIGRVALKALDEANLRPAAVGGLTLGADPVAYAIAHTAALAGRTIDAFTVRKQAKAHGTARLIEGPLQPNTDVIIVEDVVTSGDSALRAVASVREEGCNVLAVFALVDREQGGVDALAAEGLKLISLYTAAELLAGMAS